MRTPHSALGLAVVLLSLLVACAAGQDPGRQEGGIGIGPLKLVADVTPGQTWEGSVRVLGRSDTPAIFDVDVSDLAQSPVGHKQLVDRGQGARSAAAWIDVPPEVTVAGGERRDLPVTVRVPVGAYGEYSAFVAIRPRREEPTARIAATVIPTVNVEVLVRVRSSGPLEVGVEEIGLDEAGTGSRVLTLGIHNTGVWVAEIRGDVLLYPASGGFPDRVELPYRSDGRPYELYPGQTINLSCQPASDLREGAYRALARLDLGDGRESRREFSLSIPAAGGGVSAVAGARTELGTELRIEQPVQEIQLPAGAERSVPIRVVNTGDEPIRLTVSVEDARLESDGRWTYAGSPISDPGLTCEVAPDSITLAPRAGAAAKLTLRLDRDASPRSTIVKGVRFVGRAGDQGGDGPQTEYDAGAFIIIAPASSAAASLEIAGLELVRARNGINPGSAVLIVANDGDAVGEIRGRMLLSSEDGQLLAEMAMGSRAWERVMPGSQRRFRMRLPIVGEGVFTVLAELEQKAAPDESLQAEVAFTSTEAAPEGLLDE